MLKPSYYHTKIVSKSPVESISYLESIELDQPAELDFRDLLNAGWKEWINRFSIWWLKRSGLLKKRSHKNLSYRFEEILIDKTKIIEEIRSHMNSLYRRYEEYPTVVFIGRDIHEQVMRLRIDMPITSNNFPIDGSSHPLSYMLGVDVVVVPWMEGIFAWNPNYSR